MKELKGISVSPGIVVGKAFLYVDDKPQIPNYAVSAAQIPGEIARFRKAQEGAILEVEALKERSDAEMGSDGKQFLEAHLLMVSDPDFGGQVETKVKESRSNAEWAMYEVVGGMVEQLEASEDHYLRERAIDIS